MQEKDNDIEKNTGSGNDLEKNPGRIIEVGNGNKRKNNKSKVWELSEPDQEIPEEVILNQLAEIFIHSFFKSHPKELENDTEYNKAA